MAERQMSRRTTRTLLRLGTAVLLTGSWVGTACYTNGWFHNIGLMALTILALLGAWVVADTALFASEFFPWLFGSSEPLSIISHHEKLEQESDAHRALALRTNKLVDRLLALGNPGSPWEQRPADEVLDEVMNALAEHGFIKLVPEDTPPEKAD